MDMIGGIHKHGRTKSDSRNLFRHLMKDARKVELVNSVADNLSDFIGDLELMRDATKADAAFLHIFLSPSIHMTDNQLRRAAQTVVQHFGADENPYAIVYHDKPRASDEGERHVHLVVGRVSSDLVVLENKFEKIRLETAVRICEYEAGEPPVFGRHYKSSMKWLREHRPDVGEWLFGHFGDNAEKPQSAASPDKRQSLERKGLSLSGIRKTVSDAWANSPDADSFQSVLQEYGLSVAPGEKEGVFLVVCEGTEVGALDRLLKVKRAQVRSFMELTPKENSYERSPINGGNSCTSESDLQQGSGSRANADAVARHTDSVLIATEN